MSVNDFRARRPGPNAGVIGAIARVAVLLAACSSVGCVSAPATPHDEPKPFVNTLGMKMVYIPPGAFVMGAKDPRLFWSRPRHPVRITKGFFVAACEVTNAQYRQYDRRYNSGRYEPSRNWRKGAPDDDFLNGDQQPVVRVSWRDAARFCKWLSRREGRRYRLPTEAEWEYACRAGTDTAYWWGDEPDVTGTVANVSDRNYYKIYPNSKNPVMDMDDGYMYSAPVGSYRPNPFGLYDMVGNAAEWCQDRWARLYYERSPAVDPQGPGPREKHRHLGLLGLYTPYRVVR
jgi:formylglycine-generating enzyme required for sulfatase activity